MHHGAYILSRLHNGRTPLDFSLCRATMYYVPKWLANRVLVARASRWLDPVASGFKPKPSKPLSQIHFIINEQLPFKVGAEAEDKLVLRFSQSVVSVVFFCSFVCIAFVSC